MKARKPVVAPIEDVATNFASRAAFVQAAAVDPTESRLFCTVVRGTVALNTQVRVSVGFDGDPVRFSFIGSVLRVVEQPLRSKAMGALIGVTGEEQKAFGAVLSYARGLDPALGRRSSPRKSARISARLGDGLTCQAVLLDLSLGGAFAHFTGEAPPLGSLQPLEIGEGNQRDVISVRVAWIGMRAGSRGCGLEFLELGERSKAWLARALES